jgi:HK97 family phage portal protein
MTTTQIIVNGASISEVVPQIAAAASPDDLGWLTAGIPRSYNTDAGQRMTPQIALTYSSVWQSCSLISTGVSGLPLEVYRRDPQNDDRERFRLHPAWSLLNLSPENSPTISANTFRECLQTHALLWGNGFAEIKRNGAGRPVAMTLLPPDLTWADNSTDELTYWTTVSLREDARQIPARNVFHLKGMSGDGVMGYSVFQMARNSWGLGLAQEKHGNRHWMNNARPNIALKTEAMLNEDQATSLRQRFEDRHRGLDAPTATAVLSGGLDIVPFSISNQDGQWLESRRFSRTEVASWFNLPPHFLGDSGTTGYASLVEENRRYLQQTLLPWLRKWQAEADLKLLSPNERAERLFYFEHNLQSLLDADTAAVVDQVTRLIQSEVITTNEARAKLNLNRREDGLGDDFRNPAINPAAAVAEAAVAEEEEEVVAVSPTSFEALVTDQVTQFAPEKNDNDILGEACRNLLADRLRHLQESELKKIVTAAKRRNVMFVKWAQKHFDDMRQRVETAVAPISAVWEAAGVKLHAPSVAHAYATEHRGGVLNTVAACNKSQLPHKVTELYHDNFETWPSELARIAWEESHVVSDQ